MIRLIVVLLALAAVAFGFSWIADHPGGFALTFGNLQIDTSLPVALVALVVLFVVVWAAIAALRLIVGAPGLLSAAGRVRGQEKGRKALARGMIAAAAGDVRAAERAGVEATRRLRDDSLVLLLEAQNAQLSGDREAAGRIFRRMVDRPDMRLLGLRGLHAEALRRGDSEAAYELAARAHAIAPLPWAAQAVLEHQTSRQDWAAALAAVDANAAHKAIDRATADRQRAVLLTAQARALGDRDPEHVLRLSQEALKLAPDLVPAALLAAEALTRKQEIRKAAKTIEATWRIMPHPDLARAYLGIRPGDSASDRLARAETLSRIDRDHPESRMIIARAALEARNFLKARRAMAPLIQEGRPTRRMCLLMADIEEAEHGATGALREWLARAARAPRDPTWVADGMTSDVWAPVSPVTGRLDAFVWKTPDELLSAPPEGPMPPVLEPPDAPEPEEAATDTGPEPLALEGAAGNEAAAAAVAKELPPSEGAAAVASDRAAAPASRKGLRPVLFPHPPAPDDPGPGAAEAEPSAADEERRLA
jgi:HemY protein